MARTSLSGGKKTVIYVFAVLLVISLFAHLLSYYANRREKEELNQERERFIKDKNEELSQKDDQVKKLRKELEENKRACIANTQQYEKENKKLGDDLATAVGNNRKLLDDNDDLLKQLTKAYKDFNASQREIGQLNRRQNELAQDALKKKK